MSQERALSHAYLRKCIVVERFLYPKTTCPNKMASTDQNISNFSANMLTIKFLSNFFSNTAQKFDKGSE